MEGNQASIRIQLSMKHNFQYPQDKSFLIFIYVEVNEYIKIFQKLQLSIESQTLNWWYGIFITLH